MDTKIVYQNAKYEVHESELGSIFLRKQPAEYATVVALQEGRVVVVKQFREAAQLETYELPGGGMKPGEDPEAAARRELLEETGLVCGQLVPLGDINNCAFVLNCLTHLYFTEEIIKQEEQHLDADENIEIQSYPVEEVFARLSDGRFADSELAHAMLLARLKGLL